MKDAFWWLPGTLWQVFVVLLLARNTEGTLRWYITFFVRKNIRMVLTI